jgi:hypothetical protein
MLFRFVEMLEVLEQIGRDRDKPIRKTRDALVIANGMQILRWIEVRRSNCWS